MTRLKIEELIQFKLPMKSYDMNLMICGISGDPTLNRKLIIYVHFLCKHPSIQFILRKTNDVILNE